MKKRQDDNDNDKIKKKVLESKTMKKRQVRQHFLRQISLQLLKDFLGFANYFIVQLEETKNNWPAKPCDQNIYFFLYNMFFSYKLIGFKFPPFPISPAPRYSVMLSTSSLLIGNPTVWLIAVKTAFFASLLKGIFMIFCCQNHEFPTCTLRRLDRAWYFPPCS